MQGEKHRGVIMEEKGRRLRDNAGFKSIKVEPTRDLSDLARLMRFDEGPKVIRSLNPKGIS
jgi:hypothetical protein